MHLQHSEECAKFLISSAEHMFTEKPSIPYYQSSKQNTALLNENQLATLHDADDDTVSIGLQMLNHQQERLTQQKQTLPTILTCTTEVKHMIFLTKIMDDMQCPDYGTSKVIDWAKHAAADNFDFNPSNKSREKAIEFCYLALQDSQDLLPKVHPFTSYSGTNEELVKFDFVPQLKSLLQNKSLMTSENLAIDTANPFGKHHPTILGEAISGSVHTELYNNLVTDPDNQFMTALICYIDKAHVIDDKYVLEPLTFTLAVFKEEARRYAEFWRPLGYVSCQTKSKIEKAMKARQERGANYRDYHTQLGILFEQIRALQRSTSDALKACPIVIDGKTYTKDILVPILCFIVDAQAGDYLTGRYFNRSQGIHRLHRACLTKTDDIDKPDFNCRYVDSKTMFAIMNKNNKRAQTSQQQNSVYYLPNHAFKDLFIGCSRRSIFGATPTDCLHNVRHRLIRQVVDLMLEDLSEELKLDIDRYAQRFHEAHRQSARQQYPPTDFSDGLCNMTRLSAGKVTGMLFVLCCLLMRGDFWKMIQPRLKKKGVHDIDLLLQTLEALLAFDAWTHKKQYWNLVDTEEEANAIAAAKNGIKILMRQIKERFPKVTKMGWKTDTFHAPLHLVDDMVRFGAPCNFSAERPEHNHKYFSKNPGRRARKKHLTFEFGSAKRYCDKFVLDEMHARLMEHSEQVYAPIEAEPDAKLPAQEFRRKTSIGTRYELVKNATTEEWKVKWHSQTDVHKLSLLPNLLSYLIAKFDPFNTIFSTEITLHNTMYRCHPSYQSGTAWYDWVWENKHPHKKKGENWPCRVVSVAHPANCNSCLIVQRSSCRVKDWESALFQSWQFKGDNAPFEVLDPKHINGSVFVIFLEKETICTTLPYGEWPEQFI